MLTNSAGRTSNGLLHGFQTLTGRLGRPLLPATKMVVLSLEGLIHHYVVQARMLMMSTALQALLVKACATVTLYAIFVCESQSPGHTKAS